MKAGAYAPGVVIAGLLFGAVMFFAPLSGGPAWSALEPDSSSVAHSAVAGHDVCLPLLKAVHQNTSRTTAPSQQIDEATRRVAGTAAALGLVFGVQYALGPIETRKRQDTHPAMSAGLPASGTGQMTEKVSSVAAYRRCVSQYALEARNEWMVLP